MTTKLSESAMLVSLSIKSWSARKLDKRITFETNNAHGAAPDAGRYNKSLLAKDALAEISKIAGEARTYFYACTLPWLDQGIRIKTTENYDEFSAYLTDRREAHERAVSAFINNYDFYVQDAKQRLNGMFDAADYPHARDVSKKFGFRARVMPWPDTDDFRANVSDLQAEQIRSEMKAATMQAIEDAMHDVWSRIATTVGNMVEKLQGYDPDKGKEGGVFRDSLVSNVRDLVALLPSLNLTKDQKLADMTSAMEWQLCAHDADELREDKTLRESVALAAQTLLAHVNTFMA